MPPRTYPQADPDFSNELNGTHNGHEDSASEGYASDTPDASMTQLEEIGPNEFPRYFLQLNRRLYPSAPTPYPFPVDTPEQERFTLLHQILNRFIGAHYVGPVLDVLAPEPGRQKMALDLCTGNGKWVLAMEQEFSHVHFRGIDIVPIVTRYPPPTVLFEVHDVNDPYRWNDGTFDLVHARTVSMAVRDYPSILQEIARVLRPGGLFVSCELGGYAAFDPSFQNVPSVDAPATVRFFDAVTNALASRGIQPIAHLIPTFITDSGFFVDITVERRCIPIGVWPSDVESQNIGADYLRVCQRYAESSEPFLRAAGWSRAAVERMITDYIQEIHTVNGLVEVLYTVHARRV